MRVSALKSVTLSILMGLFSPSKQMTDTVSNYATVAFGSGVCCVSKGKRTFAEVFKAF